MRTARLGSASALVTMAVGHAMAGELSVNRDQVLGNVGLKLEVGDKVNNLFEPLDRYG
jgi:hypothetical protein